MGLVRGQDDHLARAEDVDRPLYAYLHTAFWHVNEGVEGRRVLAQPLPLVEGKNRDRPCLLCDYLPAYDRLLLISDQIDEFPCGRGSLFHLCSLVHVCLLVFKSKERAALIVIPWAAPLHENESENETGRQGKVEFSLDYLYLI